MCQSNGNRVSTEKIEVLTKNIEDFRESSKNFTENLPAMNQHRSRRVVFLDLRLVMRLRLMHDLQDPARNFWHFTVNSRPSVVLEMCNVNCVIYLTIRDGELALRVVGTALALNILY